VVQTPQKTTIINFAVEIVSFAIWGEGPFELAIAFGRL
jgi:hypothetical protein